MIYPLFLKPFFFIKVVEQYTQLIFFETILRFRRSFCCIVRDVLCEHYMRFDHLIDWNNLKILKTEAHYSKRLTSEAWFINSHPHVMN